MKVLYPMKEEAEKAVMDGLWCESSEDMSPNSTIKGFHDLQF